MTPPLTSNFIMSKENLTYSFPTAHTAGFCGVNGWAVGHPGQGLSTTGWGCPEPTTSPGCPRDSHAGQSLT